MTRPAPISSSRSLQPRKSARAQALAWQPCTESSARARATSGFTANSDTERRSRSIFLRRTAPIATAPQMAHRQELTVCGTETLLLVEDQGALREMLTHVLRYKGYKVLSANGGPDALQQMAATR